MTQAKLKSLLELTELSEEVVNDFKGFSSRDYALKALDSFQDYKNLKKVRSKTDEHYEEMFIYYTVCSRIVGEIMPTLPDFQEMSDDDKGLRDIYDGLVRMLTSDRKTYEQIRDYIKANSATITAASDDDLIARFQRLKSGSSSSTKMTNSSSHSNTPSPISSFRPSPASPLPQVPDNHNGFTIPPVSKAAIERSQLSLQIKSSKRNSIGKSSPRVDYDSFSKKECITIDDITSLLDSTPNDILLLDLRERTDYELDHIRLTDNVTQIDPFAVRENYTASDIENLSTSTNPDEERQLFAKRNQFELIIIIDQKSTIHRKSPHLNRLLHILKFQNTSKPLKRYPVFLNGGFTEWQHFKNTIKSPLEYSKPVLSISRKNSIVNSADENPDIITRRSMSYGDPYPTTPSASPMPKQYSPLPGVSTHHKELNTPVKSFKMEAIPNSPAKPKPVFFYNNNVNNNNNSIIKSTNSNNSMVGSYSNGSSQFNLSYANRMSKPVLPPMPSQQLIVQQQMPPTSAANTEFQKQLKVITGLANLGNSCYMNSGLQCLTGAKKMTEFFLNGSYRGHINVNSKLGSKGILANEYALLEAELFKNSTQSGKARSIVPIRFRKILASLNSNFRNADQQDCSEFLNYLLDSLHEDLNENGNHKKLPELTKAEEEKREKLPIRVASTIEWERYLKTNFSIIVDIFQGQILSQLKCLECGSTSTTYNAFSTLSLPIPAHNTQQKISLKACFDDYVKPELLTADNRWYCSNCKKKSKSSKQLGISRLPQVLIIHLKRFKLENYLSKINNYIEYPMEMNLDNYWPPVRSEAEQKDLSLMPLRGQVPPFNYRLFAVINHYGNLINGHYTSFVDKGDKNGWCYFDDDKVTKHCSDQKVVNGDAYVLFYVRV